MIAVFLRFNGGLWASPKVFYHVCADRASAERFVERNAFKFEDSFTMTRDEFERQYGPLPATK